MLQVKKQATITGSYAECDDLITQFKEKTLPLTSGCDMEGSLEAQVTGVLNNIRETASKVSLHAGTCPGLGSSPGGICRGRGGWGGAALKICNRDELLSCTEKWLGQQRLLKSFLMRQFTT